MAKRARRKSSAAIRKVAHLMRKLDLCMMTTRGSRGGMRARPMSNNGEVEFDGDVWFFSEARARKVRDIEAEPTVHLSYIDLKRWLFISMTGRAVIVKDVEKKNALWLDELERWFKKGPESESIVLIKVTPTLVAYWSKTGEGEISLR
ncbi:MAG TPA: pyridoxamine 5'-phosphate oxidase family protein [Vicinamibacterales bacterium]